MASIEQRGGAFRVRWRTVAGDPRSRKCPDRQTARKLKAEVERAHALGRDWDPTPEIEDGRDLESLAADYLIDCQRRLKASTCDRKLAVLGVFLEFAGPVPAAALSRPLLERWHGQLITRIARRTAAAYLGEGMQLWRWASEHEDWERIVQRPRAVDPGPVPASVAIPAPPLWAVDAAIGHALESRAPWVGRLMTIMRYTGIRPGQARFLEWRDVDLQARTITIRPELGKTSQEQTGRTIPMHEALAEALAGWGRREGRIVGMHPKPHARPLERIWRLAGHDARQPLHGIRHAVASVLRGAGIAEDIIGRIVGHAPTVTGGHYIDAASVWPMMVEAVALIPRIGVPGVSKDIDSALNLLKVKGL